jgi:Asp-tRNA(Asn)/Glu-tRNA(Gln) amidotransferase A subunit family amidase
MARLTRRQFTSSVAGLAAATTVLAPALGASQAWAQSGSDAGGDISTIYDHSDALDLAALVRRGMVTPMELLDEAIRRVEALNPTLNAVTLKHYELARAAITKGLPRGPLAGVPFLLKDLGVQLAGTPTTGGSRSLFGLNAKRDSTLVEMHKRAGLVIFGKTNTPEFGMALTTESIAYGPCHNPWNLDYSTGGSSGGSAAAVAAGIVPIAHGTDGGGSIRVPASACGVFGFKPTRMLTPRGPSTDLGPSAMSVGHALSRTVRDSAFLLDLTAVYEPGAPAAAPGSRQGFFEATQAEPRSLRIALNLTEPSVKMNPETRQGVLTAGRLLEDLGHSVEEAAPGIDYDELNHAQNVLMLSEFSQGMDSLARAIGKPIDSMGLEPLSQQFTRAGLKHSAREYIAACHVAYAAGARMARFQKQYDIVLQAVTTSPAPRLGTISEQPGDTIDSFVTRFKKYSAYTHLFNLTGQPSASVPMDLSDAGLPLAAMLSARNGEDALLLSVCAQLEQAAPWFDRRPPLLA